MKRYFGLVLVPALVLGCEPAGAGSDPAADSEPASAAEAGVDRVFEMRTYIAQEGRLEDLERRFRDHTIGLFTRNGMTNIGYWIPQDPERAHDTLIYILAYPNMEAREASWAAFQSDPEWQAARSASEEQGALVRRVESVFLDPTDYSPLR